MCLVSLGSGTRRRGQLEPVALGTTHSISCPSGQQPGKLRARKCLSASVWTLATSASLRTRRYGACSSCPCIRTPCRSLVYQHGTPLSNLSSSLGSRTALVPNEDAEKGENHSPRPTHCILWIEVCKRARAEKFRYCLSRLPFFCSSPFLCAFRAVRPK